jgi:anti-sigma-K factor RskA
MEMNPNYEMVSRTVRQLCPVMARTSSDSTEIRIAKSVFRWSLAVAGAAVVVVVVQ